MADRRMERNSDEGREAVKLPNGRTSPAGGMVVCVDAGGTSCRVALMSTDGEVATGIGGPCNVTTTPLDVAFATITRVVQDALDGHPATRGQPLPTVSFSRVWVGLAGYDRLSLKPLIDAGLSELFGLQLDKGLRVSTDIDLLPAALSSRKNITSVIVLVVGTGSVAMSYRRDGNEFQRIGRIGGWGRLLGDDGSGYTTGREGIRRALWHCDFHSLKKSIGTEPSPFPPLPQAILEHFRGIYPDCNAETLLSTLLVPPPGQHGEEDGDVTRTKNIASAASVVLSMAAKDTEARQIVESGASSVAELVNMLVEGQNIDVERCALVLGGGLMRDSVYKESVLGGVRGHCGTFGHVDFVGEPVIAGAKHLLDISKNGL